MKQLRRLFIAIALIPLTGCALLTKPFTVSPLVIASCPRLAPLGDATFGATTEKLVEVAGIYYECRRAAGVVD